MVATVTRGERSRLRAGCVTLTTGYNPEGTAEFWGKPQTTGSLLYQWRTRPFSSTSKGWSNPHFSFRVKGFRIPLHVSSWLFFLWSSPHPVFLLPREGKPMTTIPWNKGHLNYFPYVADMFLPWWPANLIVHIQIIFLMLLPFLDGCEYACNILGRMGWLSVIYFPTYKDPVASFSISKPAVVIFCFWQQSSLTE